MTPEQQFEDIAERMVLQDITVSRGKMMSSPGIQYKGKNFTFFWDDTMLFKLGKAFDPDAAGLEDWEYLSPFKTKAPMKAWFRVPAAEAEKWAPLAEQALAAMKEQLG